MRDDEVPDFSAAVGVPGIVDAHVHFLPDRVQGGGVAVVRSAFAPWPITYRWAAEDRLAALAALGVRHHTAPAYPHRPGLLRCLDDHTFELAQLEPAVILPSPSSPTQPCSP